MSLKAFHIFFIIISTTVAFGFGVWIFMKEDEYHFGFGILSLLAGVSLIIYGIKVFKKFKELPS